MQKSDIIPQFHIIATAQQLKRIKFNSIQIENTIVEATIKPC